jgi:hypothetical protein
VNVAPGTDRLKNHEVPRSSFVLRYFGILAIVLVVLCFVGLMPQKGKAADGIETILLVEAPQGMFQIGEDLTYEVNYTVIPLGTIRLQVIDTIAKPTSTVYRAKAFMDSYSGLPFVNLHYVFYSEIAPAMYSIFFSGYDTKDPLKTYYVDYAFDYGKKIVLHEKGLKQTGEVFKRGVDTVAVPYQDGLSLFYYARANSRTVQQVNVPTYMNEQKASTYINFMNKIGKSEIDAVDYPIETVEFDGRVDFVGIFGMTGYYQGWFSNDVASVPITAKMKVIIGSVDIELTKWNRPGWIPPRYTGK